MSLLHSPLYLGFIAASLALIALPGPNSTLIVANTITHGLSKGFSTLAGTSTGLVVQLSLIIFGLTETASVLAAWFDRLRWVGVAYLVYLGLRQWLAKPAVLEGTVTAATPAARRFYWQGLAVCLVNPKTLAFFAAFLPQFVEPSRPILPQLLVLGVTFVALAIPGDSAICLLAGRIRPWIVGIRFARLRNRISGTCLLACGLGLALARRS
jgi:threonine/homoserine/homoserine lactone efflux protein